MALVPMDTAEGDMVCIFLGAKVPRVIHKAGNARYELVEEGYLHGLWTEKHGMAGERRKHHLGFISCPTQWRGRAISPVETGELVCTTTQCNAFPRAPRKRGRPVFTRLGPDATRTVGFTGASQKLSAALFTSVTYGTDTRAPISLLSPQPTISSSPRHCIKQLTGPCCEATNLRDDLSQISRLRVSPVGMSSRFRTTTALASSSGWRN